MTTSQERAVSAIAAAGLVVMAVLCLSGGPARAVPAAGSGRVAIQILRPAAQPGASVPAQAPGGVPDLWGDSRVPAGPDPGRIALLAVAAGAVAAFTVLQISARSRDRRTRACADRNGRGTPRCQPGGN